MSVIEPASREPVEAKRARFTPAQMDRAYIEQGGYCAECPSPLCDGPVHADHIIPVELGGKTCLANLQLLCVPCHKAKTREDIKRIRKAQRLERDSKSETRRKSPHRIRGRGFGGKDPLR